MYKEIKDAIQQNGVPIVLKTSRCTYLATPKFIDDFGIPLWGDELLEDYVFIPIEDETYH